VPRPDFIELGDRREVIRIPILFEDRSVLAIDKPAGWMLVPFNWQRTPWNLHAAITSSIRAGDFWARSRNLKFLRNIHRLDAETTGVLLLGKSPGAVETLSELFESRRMEKLYLAVVAGKPKASEWVCEARLSPESGQWGRVQVDPRNGKEAVTRFKVLAHRENRTLLEARPLTGRTHQIRVHLLDAGHPILGDELYGESSAAADPRRGRRTLVFPMGLRAVYLAYVDPFRRHRVEIKAPEVAFLEAFGFSP
jgi:RluA family pseudouridine synthase